MGIVKASDFRRRIQLQQEDRSQKDGAGGFRLAWAVVPGCSSVPAKITYPPPSKKGDEKLANDQVQSSVFANVTIRYRPSTNIDASMRIVYGTRIFNIRTIFPPDEEQKTITIQAEELQAKGTLHT